MKCPTLAELLATIKRDAMVIRPSLTFADTTL